MRWAAPVVAALSVALALAGVAAAAGSPTAAVRAVPSESRFGDSFELEAVVRIPGDEAAVVLLDPAPFTAIASAETTRGTDGESAVVTVRQRVACLDRGCLPGATPRTVETAPVAVRIGGATETIPGSTVSVTISGRVPASVVRRQDGGFRTDASVPHPTYGISPGALTGLLLAAGAVALLGALGLLVPDAHRRLRVGSDTPDDDALARAVRLLRESAARAAADRRRAAGLVSRVLGARGRSAQAGRATRLAWSRPEPAPVDAVGLADAVERGEEAR